MIWISQAIKPENKGKLRGAAKKAGMSTKAYAQKHKGDKGKTGARSRLALTLMQMHKK